MTPARRRQIAQARAAFVRGCVKLPSESWPEAGPWVLDHYAAHQAAAQLEELAAQPIDGTTAEKLAEVLRPLPDPPAQDAPRRPRKRKKPRTARRGRPPLAEAGGAAERLSVSLAPETLAEIIRAARRRKVRPGTVLRELAEAWAADR